MTLWSQLIDLVKLGIRGFLTPQGVITFFMGRRLRGTLSRHPWISRFLTGELAVFIAFPYVAGVLLAFLRIPIYVPTTFFMAGTLPSIGGLIRRAHRIRREQPPGSELPWLGSLGRDLAPPYTIVMLGACTSAWFFIAAGLLGETVPILIGLPLSPLASLFCGVTLLPVVLFAHRISIKYARIAFELAAIS